jgi:hypothetical protein
MKRNVFKVGQLDCASPNEASPHQLAWAWFPHAIHQTASYTTLDSSFSPTRPPHISRHGQYVPRIPPLCSPLTVSPESKNSSQHNQAKKNHKNGYALLDSTAPTARSDSFSRPGP